MSKIKTIILSNEVTLYIDENDVLTCIEKNGEAIKLTAAQEKFLKKLAKAPGYTFSFDTLYAAYATDTGNLSNGGDINNTVAKLRATIPKVIRKHIVNQRKVGYYLKCDKSAVSVAVTSIPTSSAITQLCGEYCCFYLDPLGHGILLNSYLCIKNKGSKSAPKMEAYIISDIRNREILMGDQLTDLFSSDSYDYKEMFYSYRNTFENENDKRTSYGEGMVLYENPFANIELNMTHGKWTISITLEKYSNANRTKDSSKNSYRGGMGLLMASNSSHGIYCLRIGLVKKEFLKESFFDNHKEIIEMLKIQDNSKDAEWKPLKLSGNLDGRWYDFFMRNS